MFPDSLAARMTNTFLFLPIGCYGTESDPGEEEALPPFLLPRVVEKL